MYVCNARLEDAQAGIKIARRNINNLRYAGDVTLMAESEEKLKSLLMKVKEESATELCLDHTIKGGNRAGSILGWTVDFELYAQYLWK